MLSTGNFKTKIRVVSLLVLLVALLLMLRTKEPAQVQPTGDSAGNSYEALNFTLIDLQGRKKALREYRGKPVLVNFWATWCPPCVEEFPSLLRFAENAKKEWGLEVLAVSTDKNAEIVTKFITEKKLWSGGALPITILMDSDSKVAESYGSSKYPESFVLDHNQKIIRKFVGPQDWASQEITQWFKEHVSK